MFHHVVLSWMIETKGKYTLSVEEFLFNGVQEGNGLMKFFVETYMAPYLRKYLSLPANIDMN